MCGHSVAYDLCNHSLGKDCEKNEGNHGAGATRSRKIGHNDEMGSVKMWPYDAAILGAVTFFEDQNCTGPLGIAWANEDPDSFAYYTKDDLWHNGVDHDVVTSLMVPFGYAVDMWDSASFSGDSFTVEGPTWADNDLNMKCISIHETFNNKMASARVYRTGVYGSAVGYWKSFTATETMTFDTHYGWTSSYSEE